MTVVWRHLFAVWHLWSVTIHLYICHVKHARTFCTEFTLIFGVIYGMEKRKRDQKDINIWYIPRKFN